MAYETDLQMFTLAGLAHRCTKETELFFQRQSNDPRYCFELLRRAFVERDQQAWHLVYTQYRPLVVGWVERHSAFPSSGEEVQYFVNRAFEKMWSALTPSKFDNFPDLKSLLRYLQVCVHSTILDQVRRAELSTVSIEDEIPIGALRAEDTPGEDTPLDRIQRQEFWEAIKARLNNEQEHIVVVASFILGLKPREICAQYPNTFRDVKEVYRAKENVLARLRRDSELEELLDKDA